MITNIGFITSNGSSATVKVFVDKVFRGTPFFCEPPHAGFAPVLAYLDRGKNFHGSLREYLYACTDIHYDATKIVLWLGDSGSQNDDNVGRLTPVAWVDLENQDDQADEDAWQFPDHPPLLAAILSAMLSTWIQSGWLGTDESLDPGEVLDQAAVDECWAKAHDIAKTSKG